LEDPDVDGSIILKEKAVTFVVIREEIQRRPVMNTNKFVAFRGRLRQIAVATQPMA
jgi:hypothetical protein